MAYGDMFGGIDNVIYSCPAFVRTIALGVATPVADWTVATANLVPANIRIIDFSAHNNSGAAQAGATVTLQSNIALAGWIAVTDALAIAFNDSIARCTTIDPAQQDIGAADSIRLVKNAAADAGIAYVTMHLR